MSTNTNILTVQCVQFCSCLCKVYSCVSDALLLTLQTLSLSFLTNNSSSHSKGFLRFIVFSGSPTAIHISFNAKAWPQSKTTVAEEYNGFRVRFSKFTGEIFDCNCNIQLSTVIKLFNSNSLFQLLTCNRYFQRPTTIATFNCDFNS